MMIHKAKRYTFGAMLLIAMILFTLPYAAQAAERQISNGIARWTISNGGGSSSGSGYQLTGTVGQPDANSISLTENGYGLSGGFWGPGVGRAPTALDPSEQPSPNEPARRILLPLIQQ
ncbi:MAG: hypothetical protein IT328_01765 [Caldilineaceae bacterium]|nr:hypothetical protein [Caldilineaceae bacterium]